MTEQEKRDELEKNRAAYDTRYSLELERKAKESMMNLYHKARRLKHHRATNWIPVGVDMDDRK